jgi:hypothetical protein
MLRHPRRSPCRPKRKLRRLHGTGRWPIRASGRWTDRLATIGTGIQDRPIGGYIEIGVLAGPPASEALEGPPRFASTHTYPSPSSVSGGCFERRGGPYPCPPPLETLRTLPRDTASMRHQPRLDVFSLSADLRNGRDRGPVMQLSEQQADDRGILPTRPNASDDGREGSQRAMSRSTAVRNALGCSSQGKCPQSEIVSTHAPGTSAAVLIVDRSGSGSSSPWTNNAGSRSRGSRR